ncbi:MAG: ribose-phosphate pyrophosphokinase [Planctomycetota bacterium]|nr:ribose-phosphate pyrophosphokinase [Planctomycetota bacterium]MDI6787357.1 ribose-phosphate pyrophosphokinase [Planctomycetota bacterium]
MRNRLQVFSGNASRDLGRKVCAKLGVKVGDISVSRFPDGEIDVKINDDVRGADVFVIQSTFTPTNENLMELLIIIDCLRRASAERITAVLPYFGYARQDRKAEGRVPITAKLVANLIKTAGVDRVLTIDLHAAQIQGFFDIPLDHLYAAPVMIDYLKRLNIPNLVVVSPDVGGIKMARSYAKKLNVDLAVVDKRRIGSKQTEVMHIIGNVNGKNVLLVDDMISTATTLSEAAQVLREKGAKNIYVCATHAILCANAVEKITRARFKEVILTDTIPLHNSKAKQFIKILSIADLLGETIRRIHNSESVSSLFI